MVAKPTGIDMEEKIRYCHPMYRSWGGGRTSLRLTASVIKQMSHYSTCILTSPPVIGESQMASKSRYCHSMYIWVGIPRRPQPLLACSLTLGWPAPSQRRKFIMLGLFQ